PLRNLTHRVALKIVAEIGFAHSGLLASNLGKKASTNLGAPHSGDFEKTQAYFAAQGVVVIETDAALVVHPDDALGTAMMVYK
ncbi:MAG: hypothetical protein ACFE0S_03985, partial [Rhodospirillales bacterium]